MKIINNLLLFTFLMVSIYCHGQAVTNVPKKVTAGARPVPAVIRKSKAVGLTPDYDTTLVSQYIRSIFQDSKGNMWFGTIGEGVVRYDTKTLTYFSTAEGFQSQSVFAIAEDKAGNIWLGTDQGVYKYNGTSFRKYDEKDGLAHTDISRKSIVVDNFGEVWVGTHGGVYRYDAVADSKGRPCFSQFTSLPTINVACMMEDKQGNIWVASSDKGVFRYDGTTVVNFHEKELMGANYAGGMAQDNKGNMWFTMKNGICKYDGKKFTEYTSKDGLGGTEFWGILIERSGIIWITARGSTTRFDPTVPLPKAKAFTVYTPAQGLNCCVQSMYQDKSGNVWWGAGQGLYRFNGTQFYQVKQRGPW